MPEKFFFIVTYGRSGSTLLQSLLNCCDGACIRGENYNLLYQLYLAKEKLQEVAQFQSDDVSEPNHPWFGANQVEVNHFAKSMVTAFVNHVLNYGPEVRIGGFKEIRYLDTQIPDQEFEDYLGFILNRFPDPYIIFNTRNWESVSKSGWWKEQDPEYVKEKITYADERFAYFNDKYRRRSYHVRYEDLTDNVDTVRDMFDFLSETVSDEQIQAVLNKRLTHAL